LSRRWRKKKAESRVSALSASGVTSAAVNQPLIDVHFATHWE
jgi:hypothetical protein